LGLLESPQKVLVGTTDYHNCFDGSTYRIHAGFCCRPVYLLYILGMKLARSLKLISINAAVLALMLLVADVIVAYSRRDPESARKIDASYHHGLIPNAEFSHEWIRGDRITEKVNSFGFRQTKSDQNVRNLNQYRTVTIGDSFTEGVGLRYEDTFASLLPKMFTPVANMGVISYAPSIYQEKLRHYKKRGLSPKFLVQIVDVSDIQDEYHYHREGFKSIAMPSFINDTRLAKTHAFQLLVKGIWMINSRDPLKMFSKSKRSWLNQYYSIRNPYTLPNTPSYYQEGKMRLLQGIQRSIKLFPEASHYVIAYNWGPNEMTESGRRLYSEYIKELRSAVASYRNSRFCDMTDVVDDSNGYIAGDPHWNRLGNKQIAERFYNNCFNHIDR